MTDAPALKLLTSEGDVEQVLEFWCPGCKCPHPYRIKGAPGRETWQWNGDMVKPTFTPSLLCTWPGSVSGRRCHLFLTNGVISYCQDCTHDLAGKTVPLQPLPIEG